MKILNPVLGKKGLTEIVVLLFLFFFLTSGSTQASTTTISCPNPVTGNTAQATITFDKDSYNNGDKMNVSAHYTEGEWALCLYPPDGKSPVQFTLRSQAVDKTVGPLTVDANTRGNGSWKAVIAFKSACNSYYREGSNFCSPASVTVSGGTEKENDDDSNNSTDNQTVNGINIENPIGTSDFTALVQNVLKWLLSIAGGLALLMLIYGGFLYISSAGEQKQAEQGKKIVTWTIVGLAVILLSYSIMRTVNEIFTK